MVKAVSIKDENEKDLIKYLKDNGYLDSFSYYVKGLIKKDMNSSEIPISLKKEEVKKTKRNADFEF